MNPLLEKTKQAIMAKADQRMRPVIQKVVAAGEKTMYSASTREMTLKQLGNGTDPELIGAGVAKLMGILYNQSNKTMPMQALIPAAMILLCEGLQFLEDSSAVKVQSDFLAKCTQATSSNLLQLFGVSPDKLQGMIDKSGKGGAPAPVQPTAASTPSAPIGIISSAQGGT